MHSTLLKSQSVNAELGLARGRVGLLETDTLFPVRVLVGRSWWWWWAAPGERHGHPDRGASSFILHAAAAAGGPAAAASSIRPQKILII